MQWLTLDAGGIVCTEAMLKHQQFLLTPDISGDSWILYSEAKYLLLEQRLVQFMVSQPGFDPNSRLSRILLGNAIELMRQGNLLPIDEGLRQLLDNKPIQLSAD
ncbi:MAG: hypothetical protein KKE30_05080 [Gammaproteobacteria bacterium]|nr:hypothetical protein [Gammaproteobacteria bacterium]MBU1554056.1 hypothetical protein [Gammaproteobacteria bacterium]MBU2071668.1 hypothetical protein [Gammaproteobacteria bacterium]MBU2204024.1 hypothetical protein [Gammaproteobacteria bacterium]